MFDFSKALEECNILYCEDIESIRLTFNMILEGKTDNITNAEDGKIGLEKYLEKTPDIIITDIEMPNMSGLEMISEIREENSDIPIIITTSKGDQENLLKSIDMGVDKFLIKPVNSDMLLETLQKVLLSLEDKKMANEYRKKIELENLRKNTKEVISQLSDIFIEPIMIIQNEKIKFINKKFEEFVGVPNIGLIMDDIDHFNSLLEKKSDYCTSLSDLDEKVCSENKIFTNIDNKKNIFQVVVKKTYFEGEKEESTVYVFQDITVLEYQKVKIQNYSFRLEDYLIQTKYKTKKVEIAEIEHKELIEEAVENINIDDEESKEERVQEINESGEEEKRSLDELEEGLLRKSHVNKINAIDFIETIDSSTYEDLDELKDIEVEIDESLYDFLENPSKELLQPIVGRLDKYAFTIKSIQEFDELAQALFSTRDVLSAVVDIDSKKAETIKMFLGNIFDDLKSWRNTIFVENDTNDIHYLDSSLFSSCLQMELSLTGVKADDDEDDFELF